MLFSKRIPKFLIAIFIFLSLGYIALTHIFNKIVVLVEQDQTLNINSAEDESAMFGLLYAGVCNSGTMSIQVNKTQAFSSPDDAGVNVSDMRLQSDWKDHHQASFVLVDMCVENIDADTAYYKDHPDYPQQEMYCYNASIFQFITQKDFKFAGLTGRSDMPYRRSELIDNELSYFSAYPRNDVEGNHYFDFYLYPGEKITFQLGFWLNDDIIEADDLYMKIGAATLNKYGIHLHVE